MDATQAAVQAGQAALPAQAAFESWMKLNARVAQLCLDAGIAQVRGMQEFMTVRMAPLAQGNGGRPDEMFHAELDLIHQQTEDAIKLGRRIADEARGVASEIADAASKLPFSAAQQMADKAA